MKKKTKNKKLKELWQAISAENWQQLFIQSLPSHDWKMKSQGDIWARCINHSPDNTPSFHIDTRKGFAKCFSCGYFESDPVRVAAKIIGMSYSEALVYLLNTFAPQGFNTAVVEEATHLNDRVKLKSFIFALLNTELLDAYTDRASGTNSPKYDYAQPCLGWLKSRNIPLNELHLLPLGIVPPTKNLWDRMQTELDPERVALIPRVQDYLQELVSMQTGTKNAREGYLVFVTHLSPSTIGYFRTRQPFGDARTILTLKDPDIASTGQGFFGLGMSQFYSGMSKEYVVIVEGEFDALAAIVPQSSSSEKILVVATGGTSQIDLTPIEEAGFTEIRIVPDKDKSGEAQTKQKLRGTKLKTIIFNWPSTLVAQKDLHDAYMQQGGDKVLSSLADDKNYISAVEWCMQQAIISADPVVDAEGNRGIYPVVSQYAELLHTPQEQDELCQKIATHFGIDVSLLQRYSVTSDSEELYILRMQESLKKRFVFYAVDLGKTSIRAWDRVKREPLLLNLARSSETQATLQLAIQSISSFFETDIGLPPALRDTEETPSVVVKHDIIMGYLNKEVLPALTANLPSVAGLEKLSAGVHIFEDAILIINGTVFILGTFVDGSIKWTDLDSPIWRNYYLHSEEHRQWSAYINSADDLNNPRTMDLPKTIRRIREMLSIPYHFTNSELEYTYFAHYMFLPVIATGLREIPFLSLSGKFASGKSTFAREVISSPDIKQRKLNLIEHSLYVTGSTEAGMRQLMGGVALSLVIDEFEIADPTAAGSGNTSGKNNKFCQEILDVLRPANVGTGSKVLRGTSHGESMQFGLRFPINIVGIVPIVKGADVSRFNHIELEAGISGFAMAEPEIQLLGSGKFTTQEIADLRYVTTMWPLINWLQYKTVYDDISAECPNGGYISAGTTPRNRSTLIPILAVMKMAGEDYKSFAMRYTAAKNGRAADKFDLSEVGELFTAIMLAPKITIPGYEEYRDKAFTGTQMLTDPQLRPYLNSTNCGIFYIEENLPRPKIVFLWPMLKSTILKGTGHARLTSSMYNNILSSDRDTKFDSRETIKSLGIPELLGRITGGTVKQIDIGCIDAANYLPRIESIDNMMEEAVKPGGLKLLESSLGAAEMAIAKGSPHNI